MEKDIEPAIKNFTQQLIQKIQNNNIHIISHFDTDGITSAAILTKTLNRLGKQFSTKIIKQLNQEEINLFPRDKIIILLDLGSGNINELSKLKNTLFIIDHHEIKENPKNLVILNPHLCENYQDLCAAELTYLVSKEISNDNKDLAQLAILGMIGDTMEKEINKTRNQIIKDANIIIKKGVLIYPSTRPLNKALEYCSRPFIPGVTGDSRGTYDILEEAGIEKIGKCYKALIDLNEQEMKNLATAITLRLSSKEASKHLGNLYLLKFFNKIEDAREISAIINACSRMDQPETALLFCLGNSQARKKAERIYVKYRQHIITGLKYIENNGNIEGKKYIIINTKNNVKDTIIGTLASILSFSSIYKEGTIIIAMAYNEDKIKVSARMAGRNSKSARNLKELMDSITHSLGQGESGGHKHAAGCTISMEHEERFIDLVKRKLDVEMVKV
ncbi:MAG: DHH family phosphoesterase [archaeon]